MFNKKNIEELKGLTLTTIYDIHRETVVFQTACNREFRMVHIQDCCEHVYLDDIVGNLDDLVGSPILVAEERGSDEGPLSEYADSYTWTFYELATIKGSVTFRWYGSSNGYYSESVDFLEM